MDTLLLDPILRHFLTEDLEHGDITTDAIFGEADTASASFMARHDMVACGMASIAPRVFALVDSSVRCTGAVADGALARQGDVLLRISGPTRAMLKGERVALNLVQRMSGIATRTRSFVDKIRGCRAAIVDTRKTTPGLRMLEKYAVLAGGGRNHRYSLSDGALIKDNHIAACGSISEAVRRVRQSVPHTINIEVETTTLAEVAECLRLNVGLIMLDNMAPALMREAVQMIAGRALVEASGGVNLDNVRAIAESGVDIISIGGLTHSAPACDIGMDWDA